MMKGDIDETFETTLTSTRCRNGKEVIYNNEHQGKCCWPRNKSWRLMGLFFMCFLSFGPYFCYDNPAALQNNMMNDLGISTSQFALLYSIYSWPNILMVFVGGFLLDRVFGIRMGAVIYIGLAIIGQLIFAVGATWNMFWLMMLGRFIFAMGTESLTVAESSYAVLWFKGKELNMVFGLQQSFDRLGSTVNFLVMEPIYNYVSKRHSGPELIGIVLFLASLTCVWSMICICSLGLMDRRSETLLKRGDGEEPQVVKLSDVKDFKTTFWLVVSACITYYIAIFPFSAMGKVFFMEKYSLDAASANNVNSLLYFVSAVSAPLCGFMVDKTGKNISWLMMGMIGTIVAYGILTFTYVDPYLCIVIMGIFHSMVVGNLWPLIALIVPDYQLGTAYGTAQAVLNLGLAIVPILAGIIIDKSTFFMLGIFCLAWLGISFAMNIFIWLSDKSQLGGYLNMTPKQRKMHMANNRINQSKLSNE